MATSSSPRGKRIAIFAVGSRGDVQPYATLALALRQRGARDVWVATEARLQPLVAEFGVDSRRLEGDSTGVLFEPATQKALRDGSFFTLMKLTQAWEKSFDKRAILRSYEAAAEGADIVVASGLTMTQSLCVAQKHGAAWVPLILGPTYPTSEFPLWALSSLAVSRCLNRWTYGLAFKALWGQEAGPINSWRTECLGLPPLPKGGAGSFDVLQAVQPPVLIACSTLLCGPARRVPGDYPPNVHVGGFILADAATTGEESAAQVDPRVAEFVARGHGAGADQRPLVYLGFGSMPAPDPAALLSLALGVCDGAKVRAVVAAGWSALGSDPRCISLLEEGARDGSLLCVPSVPHPWLFPRCAAVVHHAGVGTTAAALAAGVPQVPCPVMLDQPHNAKLLVSLGVAPAVLPFNARISAKTLAELVSRAIREPRFRTAAAEAAGTVRRESSSTLDTFCKLILQAAPLSLSHPGH